MTKETRTLDKLYLEWSQFTEARTSRELSMASRIKTIDQELVTLNLSIMQGTLGTYAIAERLDKIRARLLEVANKVQNIS